MADDQSGRAQGEEQETSSGGLWHHRDFLKLWAGQSISLFGSQVSAMALPLTAVLMLEGSASEMGFLKAAESLPWLLFGLLAGAWLDRIRRRPVMIATDIGRGLLLALIPCAAWLGVLNLGLLYAVAFLVSVLTVFFGVAYQSYLPSLIGREQIVDGNAKLEASASVALLAGPGVAGVLVQVFTAPIALLANAGSFLASGLSLAFIRAQEPPPAPRTATEPSVWEDIREGLSVVFRDPILRAVTLFAGAANLFVTLVWTVLPLYLVRDLGVEPAVYGVIIAVGTGVSLPAALMVGWIARRVPVGRTIVIAAMVAGLSTFLLPLSSVAGVFAVPLIVTGIGVSTFVITVASVNTLSMRQALAPDHLLGRVNATARVLGYGAPLLGALLAGTLGDSVGLPLTLAVGALGQLLAGVWLALTPVRDVRALTRQAEAA